MRHTLRPLALAVGLLAAMPALAADSDLSEKDKYDRILRELQAMKRDLEDLRTMAVQVQATDKHVSDLQRRMESLEQAFERLAAARTRISSSFTPTETATASATIRIQNRYSVPATVYINGRAIAVPAFDSRRVSDVPAGAFTYEVQAEGFGVIQSAVSRTVSPNETFSIFINPPARVAEPGLALP
jgi:hypothetical protein